MFFGWIRLDPFWGAGIDQNLMAMQHSDGYFPGPEQREALYRGKAFGGLVVLSPCGAKKVATNNHGFE